MRGGERVTIIVKCKIHKLFVNLLTFIMSGILPYFITWYFILTKTFRDKYCYSNFRDQKTESKLGSRTQLGGNGYNTYDQRFISGIHKELLEVSKEKTNTTIEKQQGN